MSATRATCPSRVAARRAGSMPRGAPSLPFECFAIPFLTSHVRLRPRRSRSSTSDDSQAVLVVIEPSRHEPAQDPLAGVAERSVAEIVAQRDRLREVLVQAEDLRHGSGDLGHLQGVGEPRPVVVAGRREEHLGLVLEPAKRLAVHDAIAVAMERRPNRIVGLGPEPPLRLAASRRVRWRGTRPRVLPTRVES